MFFSSLKETNRMTLHLSPTSLLARNKQKQKEWRQNHPERVKAFHQKHNARMETKDRKLQWARENRDHINERRRQQYRQRKENKENIEPPEPTIEGLEVAGA